MRLSKQDGPGRLIDARSQALPSLYSIDPSLQALTITSSPDADMEDKSFEQAVPIFAFHNLEEQIADDIRTFVKRLPDSEDVVVVVDANGVCRWSSNELEVDPCPVRGAAWLKWDLERALLRVLTGNSTDMLMDQGG